MRLIHISVCVRVCACVCVLILCTEYTVWNGNATLNVWNSPQANRVTGTDGQNFAMGLTENDTIVSWVDSVFRIANLFVNKSQNSGSMTVKGVKCLWFVENITDYSADPAYWGYAPSGVFNISSASQGTPALLPCTRNNFLCMHHE